MGLVVELNEFLIFSSLCQGIKFNLAWAAGGSWRTTEYSSSCSGASVPLLSQNQRSLEEGPLVLRQAPAPGLRDSCSRSLRQRYLPGAHHANGSWTRWGFLASTGRVLRDFYSTEMGPTVHVDFLLCDHLPKLRLKDCQESAKGIN